MSIDLQVLHDHGILVVEQLGSRSEHEGWDVYSQGAHAQNDSLYIGVPPNMEGSVATSVRLAGEPAPQLEGLECVFEGRLEIPSRVLVIGDSDRNVEIRLPVRSVAIDVTALVDEVGLASIAVLLIREAA